MTRKRPRVKVRYSRIIVLAVLLGIFVSLGAGIGFVAGAVRNMPKYDIENITGELSSLIFDKDDRQVTSLKTEKKRVILSQNEIPRVMKQAIIAIEDQRFEKHHGFDPIRFAGAVVANIKKGYGAEGGSTLTQQLVKIAVLENPEKKLRRKVQEAIIAWQVENKYSKEEILAMYLNNVYYGHGAHSLQTASEIYFGKEAKDLTLEEAAMLAGVVNAPGRYSPYLNMEKAKQRQALVLNAMVSMGYITQQEADAAKEKELKLAGLKPLTFQYQSFTDCVIEEAAQCLNLEDQDIASLYTAGYKFYTTMDTETQIEAEKIYADNNNFPPDKNGKIVQSALVILDPHNGEIRALIGGRNQQGERQFNRAVHAARQPGSAFKPIAVYGPALEKGYGPATVLDDYPQEYNTPMGPKTFVNYDEKYRGLISMRTAIQYSVNTAAVKMLEAIGITEGFRFAQNLGISTLVDSGKANDMGLSLALGGLTKGVSPLEMAAAYGTFANQGVYVKPHAIRRIEDKDGNVLYEHKEERKVVMTPQTAYLMNDMLQTVVQAGTGGNARMNRPVAGKTGTTSFNVDAWFMGYTPELVGAVWLGFDKEEAMSGVFGGNYGAPIWKKVMTVAHRDLPVTNFPVPEGITTVTVDYKSGLLPSSLTPQEFVVSEKFNADYTPAEFSNVWIEMPVCPLSGQLLTHNCPAPVTRVFLKRPVPWTGEIAPEDAALEPPASYCNMHGGGGSQGLVLFGTPIFEGAGSKAAAVKLDWRYPAEVNNQVIQVFRSDHPNARLSDNNKIAEITAVTTTWTDKDIKPNHRYYYTVVTYDPFTGIQRQSNEVSVLTERSAHNVSLNTPVINGEAHIRGNTANVTIRWTKAGNSSTIRYNLYRSEKPGFTPGPENQIGNPSLTDTSYHDNGLLRNKTYYYRVIAVDSGSGEQSQPSNILQVIIN